jgi:asparagine synthase (glutamine-hydrolysing)
MCGIGGIISPDNSIVETVVLQRMAQSLAHRGPDGEATWINPTKNAGFAHRRLSVIDTSEQAAQPMHFLNRYTIVYNGEIYNYLELKQILCSRGYSFTTRSDTEVILAAFHEYKTGCLERFNGMYAFAIWDDHEKKLFCARDRFGEKPFYYLHAGDTFYFASELKSLYAAGIKKVQNNSLLLRFLLLGYTRDPGDTSAVFDANIKSLPASHYMEYSLSLREIRIKKYWDLSRTVFSTNENTSVEKFTELFSRSVKRRLRSDVTVGTSLSGGLDSSSIAAVIGRLQIHELKTFTAAFEGFQKNEAHIARKIANNFGFKNFQVFPDQEGFAAEFIKLLHMHEEPITSASVYAQYKVFELAAKENVTVLLDGQGADETIAGYDKYLSWKLKAIFPAKTATILKRREQTIIRNNAYVNAEFINAFGTPHVYKPEVRDLNDLLYFDCFCSGLEELLRYADRNSMAHGREIRLPFLDHELVSFVFSLPSSYKIRHGYTKWILRKAMKGILPDEITKNKRKTGFEPPQKLWMNSKKFIDLSHEAIKELIRLGILNNSALDELGKVHDAYEKDTTIWRWAVAGTLMLINKKGV